MGWWRRKVFSGGEKKSVLETIEKAEEEAIQECVKAVVVGVVAEGLEKTKMDMVHALYQSAIDAGEDKEEALKDALEKWEKIWTKAKEHLEAKGMDYKR
jgi:putative heme iron utilization protein